MSVLDRRVQLLMDPAQYDQVEREAARTGKSVAALIREAIRDRLAVGGGAREAAAARLLRSADSGAAPEDEWAATKTAMADALSSKLS